MFAFKMSDVDQLFHCNPFYRCGKEFLLGIDGYHVSAKSADATVWAKGDLGSETGVVFPKAFESSDKTFATEVLAAALERGDQYAGGGNC
jgi:hypothetical protein